MIPSRPLFAVAALSLAFASAASAQFSPYGSPTINNTTVTTAQTLTSGSGMITNSGSISTTGSAIPLTISGSGTTLSNNGSIINSGTARGIVADGTNIQITNGVFGGTTGLIQTVANDAVRSSSSGTSITLTNYGTISSNPGSTTTNPQQAIDWNSITTGSNGLYNYGSISANGNDAVRPGVNGVIYNYAGATMTSTNLTGNTSSDGIDAQANTGVQVTNTGTISAGRHGITGGNTTGTGAYTMSISNNGNGVIQGNNGSGINIDGINANEVITINNGGTITGNGSTLNAGETSHDGDGVDVDGVVNLTNTGMIRSLNAIGDTSEGVTVGGGTIINSGTIQGSITTGNTSGAVGRGITIAGVDKDANGNAIPVQAPYAATTITNSGLIKGDTDSAIAFTSLLTSGFSHTINNYAAATLEGGGMTVAAVQLGPDNDTINNSGAIIADSSNLAIDMGGGNNALNIIGGSASIVGNVSGGTGGTNTLAITPGSNGTFAYGGVLSNFTTVQIGVTQSFINFPNTATGGRVTLSGANTYTGTTTIYNGATLVANTPVATGSATGTSTVSVLNGGTLAGTGNVAGAVTLASGATLAPGDNSAATLTLGGNLNTTGGSTFTYDIGNTQMRSDRLTLAGTLAFTGSGQMTFNIVSNGIGTGTYDLIDFAGTSGLTSGNLAFGTVPSGFAGNFTLTGTSLLLNVTAVPEPGTVAWTVFAAVGLFVWTAARRRRAAGAR